MLDVSPDNFKISKVCPVEWLQLHSLHNSFLPVLVTFLIIVTKYQKKTQLKELRAFWAKSWKENSSS